MYLDAFTISALVDEFMDELVGGRVQDSVDVNETGLGLEVYANRKRRYLYLSADMHEPRVQLLDDKLRRGLNKPSQLGLLFRRYVEGGIIAHVSQPPWERIIHFDVEGPEGDVTIVIEPMERRSNLLLLRDDTIVDCLRRIGPEENRYRVILPAHEYVAPPPQTGKLDPARVAAADMRGLFDQVDDQKRRTQQVLTGRILGISPLLGKEVVFRASGDVKQKAIDADADTLYDAFKTVVDPLLRRDWQNGVAESDGRIEAYSVYPLKSLPGWRQTASLSEAMALFYGAPIGDDAYKAGKKPVRAEIEEAQKKLNARLASLQRSLKDDAERDVMRQSGELIFAYQYAIEDGQTELRAQYDPDEPELVIKLDPDLTPVENANRYFERYNKAKRALDDVPRLIEETKAEIAYIDQLDTDLTLAANWPEIDEVQQALQARGYWRGQRRAKIGGQQSAPLRVVTTDGFVIWVGRNSRQNEQVTFGKGSGQDLWLHARQIPGAHVIIKNDGRRIPEDVVEQAASMAAYYSAARGESSVEVDATHRKHVRKIKGAATGMVTYQNERTHLVAPRSEKEVADSES